MSTTLMNVFKNTLSPCVTWPASSCTSDVRAGSTDRWCWSCVVLRTVLQLPEPRRKVAEVFVVQRCLGWQPVLWEALEEPGGQLLRMVHVAQPDTNKDTWSEIDRMHTYIHTQYIQKYITRNQDPRNQPLLFHPTKTSPFIALIHPSEKATHFFFNSQRCWQQKTSLLIMLKVCWLKRKNTS